jgi:hypothetical protein
MAQYIQSHKYITVHHTVTAAATTKANLPALAASMENHHKTKSWAEAYKTGGEFGYSYLSYHYLFAQDGSYIQVHDTKYQRVHATDTVRGAASHNRHGIAIAIVGNMSVTPPSAALIHGIAKLCAELEKHYGVNFAIRAHKETAVRIVGSTVYYPERTGVYYTECAGNHMGVSSSGVIRTIINKTNELLQEKPWYETVTKQDRKLTNDNMAYLYNIDTQEKLKTFMPNSVIETAYVLGDYYITQFSVTNKTKYGFKKGEWKDYVIPPSVPPTPEEDPVKVLEERVKFLEKEITRLEKERKAAEGSYKNAVETIEQKNIEISDINSTNKNLREQIKDLEIVIIEKDTLMKRLESDIEWCDEQMEKLREEIKELEKSLENCSSKTIQEMEWSEIFSGVLAKLTGKKPE